MTHVTRFFSTKTLTLVVVSMLGLGVSVANAEPVDHTAAQQAPAGNNYNWTAGGLG